MQPVAERLTAAGCVAADEEAAELVAAAPDETTLDAWVTRREHGEPLAWITGRAMFCGHSLRVSPGVYVPRPHTEELARRAAAVLPERGRAVDLCTGTGAVAAHLRRAVPGAAVVGVEIDERAAMCAHTNGVAVVIADAVSPPLRANSVDVVTVVAPYVPTDDVTYLPADVQRYEPCRALDGGSDGLDIVRGAIATAARLLRPGGSVFLELGGRQDVLLAPDLAALGFDDVTAWCDDDGDLRGVMARMA